MESRLRLGQLLVDACIIGQEQLDDVLEQQKQDGRRLGTLLVERGLINETQLTQILSQQLSVPWVSLYHVDFSKRLLSLVPRDVAEKYCLVPIYVRHVRGQGDTLYVAMDDPTNDEALRTCSMWAGLPTRAMIASPTDIRAAIRLYYYPDSRTASVPPNEHILAETMPKAVAAPTAAPPLEPAGSATPVIAMQVAPATHDDVQPKSAEPAGASEQTQAEAAASAKPDVAGTTSQHAEPETSPSAEREPPSVVPQVLDRGTLEPVVPAIPTEPEPSAIPASQPMAGADDSAILEVGEEIPLESVLPEGKKIPARRKLSVGAERLMSLTLLDGTTLAMPVRRAAKRREASAAAQEAPVAQTEPTSAPSPTEPTEPTEPPAGTPIATETRPPGSLTAREVMDALRQTAPEGDSAQIQWQGVVTALFELLVRRGLISEDDLLVEVRKSP